MPTIREALTYEDYSQDVDQFAKRMREGGHSDRADFSEERAKGKANIRRFVGYAANGTVAGWMVVEVQPEDVKIEGICVDPNRENSAGVATAFITSAVNLSFQLGKGGTVTLTNNSKGTGDRLYSHMGFEYIDKDAGKMRLTLSGNSQAKWDWVNAGKITTPRGKELTLTELRRSDPPAR